jgi:hypothetical protein
MPVTGKWEGKLLDAGGTTARIVAALKQSENRITGEFSVYIASARDGCGSSSFRHVHTAAVNGTYGSRGETVQLKYDLDLGPKPVGVVFDARVTDADPHARRALIGSYSVTDDAKQVGFEGGACVLWQYRG